MVLVICKRIPVITKLRHTALTRITILPLVTAHPLHREVIQRTGPTQVRILCARFHLDTGEGLNLSLSS